MKRLLLLISYPVLLIVLSLAIGFFTLNLTVPPQVVRGGLTYSDVDLSGMDIAEASALIKNIGDKQIEKGYAAFIFENTEFLFHFNEIGLTADYSGIESSLSAKDSPMYLNNLFTAFIRKYGSAPKPAYTADAEAFRGKLFEIKALIDKESVDADIDYTADGEIVLTPSVNGVYFDVDGHIGHILPEFLSDPHKTFAIDSDAMISEAALVFEEPRVPDALLDGIDTALAQIKTPIPADCDISLVSRAAEAVNKVWLPKKGMAYSAFSFLRYIEGAGLPADAPAREYNFVASVLLHALLAGGEDYSKTESARSSDKYAYAALPGFGIELIASAGADSTDVNIDAGQDPMDFQFTNTLDGNIVIFASASDGSLNITIAGKSSLAGKNAAPYEIYSEIKDERALLYRNGKKIAEYTG